MKSKLLIFALVFCSLALSNSAQIATGGSFSLEKSVIATGGGESSNGLFNVKGTSGQSVAGPLTSNFIFDQYSGFWTPDAFVPTAASASISGKVKTSGGAGIRNVLVKLTNLNGIARTTTTGSLGVFVFSEIEVGQTYILTVNAKRYVFANPSQVISVNDELTELNFVANEQ